MEWKVSRFQLIIGPTAAGPRRFENCILRHSPSTRIQLVLRPIVCACVEMAARAGLPVAACLFVPEERFAQHDRLLAIFDHCIELFRQRDRDPFQAADNWHELKGQARQGRTDLLRHGNPGHRDNASHSPDEMHS